MSNNKRKGQPPPRYDDAFKAGAVRLVTEQSRAVKGVAEELGICVDTLKNWLKAAGHASSPMRKQRNQALLREIVSLHERYPSLGLDGLYHVLKRKHTCSRGRVHRLMKMTGIHSIRKAGFKVTTNSRHKLPIAPNLLGRNFRAQAPGTVWVSDITYIRTG